MGKALKKFDPAWGKLNKAELRAMQNRNLIPFKKGQSGNPAGRKRGQRDYATIAKEAIRKIAESRNMTSEEFEALLVKTGLTYALKGNYKFYQDHFDREFGKPAQSLKVGGDPDNNTPIGVVHLPMQDGGIGKNSNS